MKNLSSNFRSEPKTKSIMGLVNLICQHILIIFIIFKHWLLALTNLFNKKPLKDVSSEIILITGAASGLGKGVAQRLAGLGCTLVLWDVDEGNNARVAEELNSLTNSKRIHAMKCDLSSRENIYQCAKKVNALVTLFFLVLFSRILFRCKTQLVM